MLEKAGGYKENRIRSYLFVYGGILFAAIILFLSFGFVISVHDQEAENTKEISISK